MIFDFRARRSMDPQKYGAVATVYTYIAGLSMTYIDLQLSPNRDDTLTHVRGKILTKCIFGSSKNE